MIALNAGNMGVIMTRKHLLYICSVLSVGLLIYVYILNEVAHNHEIRALSEYSWTQFREECGWEKF